MPRAVHAAVCGRSPGPGSGACPIPSECLRKDEERLVAPSALGQPRSSVAPVQESGLRVFAGASSLGRRGERRAVAVGTSRGRCAGRTGAGLAARGAEPAPLPESGFWNRETPVALGQERGR